MHADARPLAHGTTGAVRYLIGIAELALRSATTGVARLCRALVTPSSRIQSGIECQPRYGCVTLVGAGPGDPELLTLKAIRAIESADVILFDALVSDSILELAPSRVDLISVGKRGGRPSCRQDDINDTMIALAGAGKRVVRLKAGDPAIFARAGEEVSYLHAAGIEVSIVPGITAASAMAAAFGISLTHRQHAKSVRFVTGHSKKGGIPEDLDWRAVADPSATTVFYMGAHLATKIAERLIALGMPEDTPVGIAASLSRKNQKIARCKLSKLDCVLAGFDRSEPLILGIGAVYAQNINALELPQMEVAVSDFSLGA